jgi:deoxyribonuclease-1
MSRKKRAQKSWLSIVIALALAFWFARQRFSPDHPSSPSPPPISSTSPKDAEKSINGEADLEMDVTPSLTDDRAISAPENFDEAKTRLKKLFARGRDFYCGCSYDFSRKPQVDPHSCGLKSNAERARRIEWEHVVPASIFGQRFSEWKKGHSSCSGRNSRGRNCARQSNPTFRLMEADMYNLEPAVGELNRARGNLGFGDIAGEPREFGACDFEVFADSVEPRPEVRGDIARIYYYMDARYPGFQIVNEGNRKLLDSWDQVDPMDDAERLRIQKIEEVQGNSFYVGRLSNRSSADRSRGNRSNL